MAYTSGSLKTIYILVMGLKMRIYLSGLSVGVAEPLGDFVKAHSGNGKLAGEGVAEDMRGDPVEFCYFQNCMKWPSELIAVLVLSLSFLWVKNKSFLFSICSKNGSQFVVKGDGSSFIIFKGKTIMAGQCNDLLIKIKPLPACVDNLLSPKASIYTEGKN